jgi:hypothetical protein
MSQVFTHYLLFCLFLANASKRDNGFSHPLYLAVTQLGTCRSGPVIIATARKVNYELKIPQQFIKFPCTGLFKMIVGVLTTCHTQYT